MKTFYRKGFLILSLLLQANVLLATDIYRAQDKFGNTTFSDLPSVNASKLNIQQQPYRYKHHVVKVYDGDTIILKNGEHVRLLGLNTPEVESRFRQGEPGGELAKIWLKNKLEKKDVFLEFDRQQRDKYDRLLAFVFIDNENINISLLQNGLATLSIIPPNLRYSEQLQRAQQQAEKEYLGIWAMAEYQPKSLNPEKTYTLESGWHRFIARPQSIKQTRKYIRLRLAKNIDIRIAKSDKHLFPEPSSYLNQRIEIRGWAFRQGEHYSIAIQHPSALIMETPEQGIKVEH